MHLWHVEFHRLGVESELKPPAYATAVPDLSCICDPHHSSRQCWILNPLIEDAWIEPASSFILVGFVSTEPQRQLFFKKLFLIVVKYIKHKIHHPFETKGERLWGGINQEVGINIHTLLYVK